MTDANIAYGVVIDNEDPDKCNRIKIHVAGYNDKIESSELPWSERHLTASMNIIDVPKKGDYVKVHMLEYDKIEWSMLDFNDKSLLDIVDAEYVNALVLAFRKLSQYEGKGELSIYWTPKIGLMIAQDKSFANIEADGNVLCFNGSKYIHIYKDTISLGSKNKSKEPAVLGDKNVDALSALNDTDKQVWNLLMSNFDAIALAATGSPYTMHLGPLFTTTSTLIKQLLQSLTSAAETKIKMTTSKVVNLD